MKNLHYNLYPNGERGFTLVFDAPKSKALSTYIIHLAEQCRHLSASEPVEIIPAYQSLTVYSAGQDKKALQQQVESFLKLPLPDKHVPNRLITIQVCYDSSLSPDLATLAKKINLSIEAVIDRHTRRTYLVHMLGFLPGFLYLGGLDERLTYPRKSTPALSVPAGSVGIGGDQTGVYPVQSPGGWHIIGRTPQALFTPDSKTPFIANPLDEICFKPISLDAYKQQTAQSS